MLKATLVSSKEELQQIHLLNEKNLRNNISSNEQEQEGFVSWLYPISLLEQVQNLAPSIIVKDGERVAGYALTTPKEAAAFHPDLRDLFINIEKVNFKGKPLIEHNFYFMGQICIDKDYRGKGIVDLLYQKHKEAYSARYDFILTEISARNIRSQKAHEKVGFKTIYTYRDSMDEWNVVVWEWD